MIDLTGHRFGRLVVIGRADRPSYCKERSCWWTCKCDCGETITTSGMYLKSGAKQSCGCLRAELAAEKIKRVNGEGTYMSMYGQVSCGEMLHMRESEGMSNREIAERLDCSTATVYKMIGKQPEGIRAPRRTKKKPVVVHETFTQRLEKMRPTEEPIVASQPNEDALDVLRLVFGQDAVRQYLAMRLYELKVTPGRVLGEEECMSALRDMQ